MTEMQRWEVTEPYIHMSCGLGEAPYYENSRRTLRFVDIVNEKLHVVDLNKGSSSLASFNLGTPVSTTADIEGSDDEMIVGAKYGFAIMNRKTKKLEYIKKVWEDRDGTGKDERMRFNDGVVDHEGRYWAGTMNDPKVKAPPTDEGVLFRLDPDMTLHRMIENVSIPNGICFSPDEKTMYFIDSPTNNVWQFKYDRKTGSISDREVFFHVEGDAVPDGMAIDVNGCLWIAICGGGKVLKVSPEAHVVGEISLPNARMITCPAFVEDDLFITSAVEEEPARFPDSFKFGGSLWKVHVGVKGMPVHRFRWR